jgi:hypothetical protein
MDDAGLRPWSRLQPARTRMSRMQVGTCMPIAPPYLAHIHRINIEGRPCPMLSILLVTLSVDRGVLTRLTPCLTTEHARRYSQHAILQCCRPNVFREFKGIGDGDKTIATARLEVKGNYIKDQWCCQFFASARCLTEGFQMHSIDIEGCSGVALLAV